MRGRTVSSAWFYAKCVQIQARDDPANDSKAKVFFTRTGWIGTGADAGSDVIELVLSHVRPEGPSNSSVGVEFKCRTDFRLVGFNVFLRETNVALEYPGSRILISSRSTRKSKELLRKNC
jgi:hypothetical protein